jgi:dihydrofolate synthase/folylpolyglutamate synthase
MAFDFFAQVGIDIGIIEVGLGGRLDSTNIITPELSIITNISIDHTNILGSTVEEIAFEKGGIIKERVPVVIGEKGQNTDDIFRRLAAGKEAPLLFAEEEISTEITDATATGLDIKLQTKRGKDTSYHLDLPGRYQEKNLRTTIAAIEVLQSKGWSIKQERITEALQKVKVLTHFGGRWDVIREEPMVVLEVAHNEGGIKQMLQHLATLPYRQLHIIIGMVKDKAADTILQLLPAEAAYYFTQAPIPRALDKHDLQNSAKAYNLRGFTFDDVNTALRKAIDSASKEDVIIVCGSIFLVAEVDKTLI